MKAIDYLVQFKDISISCKDIWENHSYGSNSIYFDYTKIYYHVEKFDRFECLSNYYKNIFVTIHDNYDMPKERLYFNNHYLDKHNLSIKDFHLKTETLLDYYINSSINQYIDSILEGKFDKYLLDENISLDENKDRIKHLLKKIQKYINGRLQTKIKNITNFFFDARVQIRTFSSKTLFLRTDEEHSLLAIKILEFTNYLLAKKESYEKINIKRNRSLIVP